MRLSLIPLFIVPCAVPTQAQTGPCTESAIKQGTLPAADDVFSYMPPYGKPVVGKPRSKRLMRRASPPARTVRARGSATIGLYPHLRRHGL